MIVIAEAAIPCTWRSYLWSPSSCSPALHSLRRTQRLLPHRTPCHPLQREQTHLLPLLQMGRRIHSHLRRRTGPNPSYCNSWACSKDSSIGWLYVGESLGSPFELGSSLDLPLLWAIHICHWPFCPIPLMGLHMQAHICMFPILFAPPIMDFWEELP